MRRVLLFWHLLISLHFGAKAQNAASCGVSLQAAPVAEAGIAAHRSSLKNKAVSSTITIPVVVHIVYKNNAENIPDAQVFDQLDILNRDFAGLNKDTSQIPEVFRELLARQSIRFCLAATDPSGQPTSGIVRVPTDVNTIGLKPELYSTSQGGSTAWDVGRYMNVWVANIGASISGYATYPWTGATEQDGIVINYLRFGYTNSVRYGGGRTLVHETGHYLGLLHTWADDTDCATDDMVADTPPQEAAYFGCPAHPQISCGGPAMFMNFMDYVDDTCMHLFTEGQAQRIESCLALYRPDLGRDVATCPLVEVPEVPFELYPQPANNFLNIRYKYSDYTFSDVRIFNLFGQNLLTAKTNSFSINISGLAPGIYMLRSGRYAKKFVVVR